jgi:hypothetical protein
MWSRLIINFLYQGKIHFLTLIFIVVLSIDSVAQVKEPIQIETDVSFEEEIPSVSNLLEQQLGMVISAYVYNSINTKSMVGLGFSVDSLFRINSTFSENMPPLLKNEIITIFKRWTELKSMKDDVEENRIIINKVYIIPIIFHFRYTSDDESVPTFKRDYVSLDKFLKNMNWGNTEMMDFIMIDLRYRRH